MPKFCRTKVLRTPWGFIFYLYKYTALHVREFIMAMLMNVDIRSFGGIHLVLEN